MDSHYTSLEPVKRDVDGTLLLLCGVDALTGRWRVDGLAAWCPTCRAIVSDIVAGSRDVSMDEPSGAWLIGVEERLAEEHQRAVAELYGSLGIPVPR